MGFDASGHPEAFRWLDGTMTGLGFSPGGISSNALATNGDGSVVVGTSVRSIPLGSGLWDARPA